MGKPLKSQPYSEKTVTSDAGALKLLSKLVIESVKTPLVGAAAVAITGPCPARDDQCDVEAVFDAVHVGTPLVTGLEKGVKYVNDPGLQDYYIKPKAMLEMCSQGSCGGDCDDHALLIAALLYRLGYTVGLKIIQEQGEPTFNHIFAVVFLPKHQPDLTKSIALDTTVKGSYVGWEADHIDSMIAIIHNEIK